jgi:hypothetical protein
VSGPLVGVTYRGRPVEELTKDELIEALYHLTKVNEELRTLHEDYVKLAARMREMR